MGHIEKHDHKIQNQESSNNMNPQLSQNTTI